MRFQSKLTWGTGCYNSAGCCGACNVRWPLIVLHRMQYFKQGGIQGNVVGLWLDSCVRSDFRPLSCLAARCWVVCGECVS